MHLIVTKLYGMRHNNCDLLKVDFACVMDRRRGYLHTLTLHMVYLLRTGMMPGDERGWREAGAGFQ